MREPSRQMSGFAAGLYDFDNDGWKDLFVSAATWNPFPCHPAGQSIQLGLPQSGR